jgi:hypothetical protein
MNGIYAVILLLGGAFLYAAFSASTVNARTAVQALIFLLLGAGGLVMNRRR